MIEPEEAQIHPRLASAALAILESARAGECCQRLSQLLQGSFPLAQVTVQLADPPDLTLETESNPPGEHRITQRLEVHGKTTGWVSLILPESQPPFSPSDRQVVQFLAAQAAAALELQRLYAAEQDRLRDEQALIQAGRRLSENLNPETLPLRILEELEAVLPYERGSLLLKHADSLKIAAQRGFPKDERVQQLNIALRPGDVYDQVAVSASPVVVVDVSTIPGWTQVEWLPMNHSWLGIPLFAQNQVAGMVSLTRKERSAFTQEDVLIATAFAMQASVALENALLYQEIKRFNQQLEEMVQQRTEELRQALHTLERMDRNRADFISLTAHELRTPLTVMMGYVGILETDATLQANPFLRQVVQGFVKGADRLAEIVESMLELVRIDNQTLKIEPGQVALSSVMRRVASDYEVFLTERRQTLDLDGMENLPVVNGDAELLLKAVRAIVINAIKFTPDGGRIRISGRPINHPELGECVELQIADNGIGIDPENHELIFEKLFSLGKVGLHSSGKFTFKGGGPGLGLAIARGIVLAHHGKIWVESAGQDETTCPGSVFNILLPVGRSVVIPS
jgi:signal transduction histidine kinase